jgi:hypothetical protein
LKDLIFEVRERSSSGTGSGGWGGGGGGPVGREGAGRAGLVTGIMQGCQMAVATAE